MGEIVCSVSDACLAGALWEELSDLTPRKVVVHPRAEGCLVLVGGRSIFVLWERLRGGVSPIAEWVIMRTDIQR